MSPKPPSAPAVPFVAGALVLLALAGETSAQPAGTILASVDPAELGLTELDPIYLVRIDPALADTARLPENLYSLEPGAGRKFSLSSDGALGLLAAAAEEAASGLTVSLDCVMELSDIASSTTSESSDSANPYNTGTSLTVGSECKAAGTSISHTASSGYSGDEFQWPHFMAGSTQDIGVTEAWQLLEELGSLDEEVNVAVLDVEFCPDVDLVGSFDCSVAVELTNRPGYNDAGEDSRFSSGRASET